MNKLKKMAVVVIAIAALGGIVQIPISPNREFQTYAAELTYYEYGDWLYSVLSDGNVCITQYDGNDEVVTVPSQINGRTVVEIGQGGLQGLSFEPDAKREIILPNTIRKIGNGAFSGLKKVEKINIPDSVKEIGIRAFAECLSLKSINLNKVEKLGFGVFEGSSALEQITIPGTIKTIPERAFHKCTGLKSLVINSGVTTIEKEAALNAPALERIVIPDSVTSIGEYAFCYSREYHEVNEGSYVGYYEYTLNADNLKEYVSGRDSAAEKYGIDNGIIKVFEGELSTEIKLPINPIIPDIIFSKGDIDLNDSVDSSDASAVLAEYSAVQTGCESKFTASQKAAADVNNDGVVDSSDASEILRYYAEASTGKTPTWGYVADIPTKFGKITSS